MHLGTATTFALQITTYIQKIHYTLPLFDFAIDYHVCFYKFYDLTNYFNFQFLLLANWRR